MSYESASLAHRHERFSRGASYLLDDNFKQIEYMGFMLGYIQSPVRRTGGHSLGEFESEAVGHIHLYESDANEYRAAWRRPHEQDWTLGHIYVNTLGKIEKLAKECIDFQLVCEHQEFILGRKMSTVELGEFYRSLTSLPDHGAVKREVVMDTATGVVSGRDTRRPHDGS